MCSGHDSPECFDKGRMFDSGFVRFTPLRVVPYTATPDAEHCSLAPQNLMKGEAGGGEGGQV